MSFPFLSLRPVNCIGIYTVSANSKILPAHSSPSDSLWPWSSSCTRSIRLVSLSQARNFISLIVVPVGRCRLTFKNSLASRSRGVIHLHEAFLHGHRPQRTQTNAARRGAKKAFAHEQRKRDRDEVRAWLEI